MVQRQTRWAGVVQMLFKCAASFKDKHTSVTTSSIICWFISVLVSNTSKLKLIFPIELSFSFSLFKSAFTSDDNFGLRVGHPLLSSNFDSL